MSETDQPDARAVLANWFFQHGVNPDFARDNAIQQVDALAAAGFSIAPTTSICERLEILHEEMAMLVEDLGSTIYSTVENEALKHLAIEAGIDWTTEGTLVLKGIGVVLQREQDVNRELRRKIKMLEAERERFSERLGNKKISYGDRVT